MKTKFLWIAAITIAISSCGGNDSNNDNNISPELEDNEWKLNAYGYQMESKTDVLSDSNYILSFTGEGTVNGWLNCNSMRSSYSVGEDEIMFGGIASTRMACPGSDNESYQLEYVFITNALMAAQSYSISSNKITITSSDSSQLVFLNVEP